MALLNSASFDNLVVHSALSIRYAITSKTDTDEWEVHRYTTKSFSFVGLTESAARSVANTLATSSSQGLLRDFYIWKKGDDDKMEKMRVQMMTDEVAAVHDEGSMWRVDVNVNEDDVYYIDEDDLSDAPSSWGFPSGGNYWEPSS